MSESSMKNETGTNNEASPNKIWVVVNVPSKWRGGEKPGEGEKPGRTAVDVDKLSSNMKLFLGQIGSMLEQTPERVGSFHFQEFELSAEVSADGSLALLGSGLHAGAKGGLKFVFRRSIPPE